MRPRLRRIVHTDYVALMGAVMAPVALGVCLPYHYFTAGAIDPMFVATIVLPICVAGPLLVAWRVWRINRLFTNGESVPGRIDAVHLFRDRGRIEFGFEHTGQTLKSWMPIHVTDAVLALQPGQEVELLVDPQRPRNAIIKRLFVP